METPENTGEHIDEVDNGLNCDQHEDELLITSGARLTIETMADFAEKLRTGLAKASSVVIQFSENVEMDVTALQVFCSACRTAAAAGKHFTYRGSLPATLLHLAAAAGSERHDHCRIDIPSCFRKFGGSK